MGCRVKSISGTGFFSLTARSIAPSMTVLALAGSSETCRVRLEYQGTVGRRPEDVSYLSAANQISIEAERFAVEIWGVGLSVACCAHSSVAVAACVIDLNCLTDKSGGSSLQAGVNVYCVEKEGSCSREDLGQKTMQ